MAQTPFDGGGSCVPADNVCDYVTKKYCQEASRMGLCMPEVKAYGALQELFSIASVKGASLVIYVIHDPTTGKIPFEPLNSWPSKVITDNTGRKVAVMYSPNLHRYALQKFAQWSPDRTKYTLSKVPFLFVNYSHPLGYSYAGSAKPMDRPLEEQFNDWENGRMYSRMWIPSTDAQRAKVKEIEDIMDAQMCEGWYWVIFHADLIVLPASFETMQRGIITFGYKLPKGAKLPVIGSLIRKQIHDRVQKNLPLLVSLVNAAGLEVDNNYTYTVNGKTVRGISLSISSDGKSYEVSIPIVRRGALLLPAIPVATALVIAAVLLTVSVFVWAYIHMKDVEAQKERLEVVRSTPENYKDLYEFLVKNGVDPQQAAQIAANVTTSMNNALSQPKSDWEKYIKYGVGAFALLIGAIFALTLLQYLPKPRGG